MSASSVQGTGPGSSLKQGQKGSESQFLGVEKLIGPRIVFTSQVTLAASTATIVFPQALPGVATDYVVLTGGSASHSYASSLTVNGFTMNGTSSQTVWYVVVKVTNATVLPPDYNYA